MSPTLSPRALIREAYARRQADDPTLTHERLAERAGMHREVVTRALGDTRGEPRPETVAKILRALGFAMVIVEVRKK